MYFQGGDHITGLQFGFKDGTRSQGFGSCTRPSAIDNYGEAVSDLIVVSGSVFFNLSAACLIIAYRMMPD